MSANTTCFTIGAGYLDLWAALNDYTNAGGSLGAAASPTALYDPWLDLTRVVNTRSAVWGDSAVWGSSAVWGASGSGRVGVGHRRQCGLGCIGRMGRLRGLGRLD